MRITPNTCSGFVKNDEFCKHGHQQTIGCLGEYERFIPCCIRGEPVENHRFNRIGDFSDNYWKRIKRTGNKV